MKEKVVIGLWPLSGDFGKILTKDLEETINFCLSSGINSFDLAPNYGKGFVEDKIGEIFQGNTKLLINTKFGSTREGEKKFSVSALRESLETSLENMKLSKVNSLFLHNPRSEIKDFDEIERLMTELKRENLINYSGISVAKNFSYECLPAFDEIQFDCNLLFLDDLKKYKYKYKKSYARSPLASGILSGKISKNSKFSAEDHRSEWLFGEKLESLIKQVEKIKEIKGNCTLASLSRKFLLENKKIDKVIFGVKSPDHVKDILKDLNSKKLDTDLVKDLYDLEKNNFGLNNILKF
tara:strand:- start:87 stop:971 length:885 start_codon:yes stop_codon:yes gene_type:complete